MKISFTKKKEGSRIISCRRKDGTITWMHSSNFFVLHDICHYVVETNLKLSEAFYGMLASGISITDFELPKEQRPFQLTKEAILAENLVNLLGIEYTQRYLDNFSETLSASYKADNDILATLNNGMLRKIREEIWLAMNRWNKLEEGKTLTFEFKE